jgi:hypothetical protein
MLDDRNDTICSHQIQGSGVWDRSSNVAGFGRDECAWRGHQVIQKLPAIGPVLAAVIIAGSAT